MAMAHPSPLDAWRGGTLSLTLAIVLTCASLQPARASSLSEVLAGMAHEHGFTLVGAGNITGVAPRPAAGDLRARLEAMLQDFNHVIVRDPEGRIQKVIIGGHRSSRIPGDGVKAAAPQAATVPAAMIVADSFATNPVQGSPIASRFGPRHDPLAGTPDEHDGIDLAAPAGTPVHASAAGRVVEADGRQGYGNYVRIQHDGVFETAYGHLDRFADGISPGARLAAGAVIGYVGATGRVTGPHLHYEILAHGMPVDPARYMAVQPAANAVAGPTARTDAGATAARASVVDIYPALRHALAVAYLAERLNAAARRLPQPQRDCTFAACE